MSLWNDIKGNATWDFIKAAASALGIAAVPVSVLALIRAWLLQPLTVGNAVAFWGLFAIAFISIWIRMRRLTPLDPRLEGASQRADGIGYKKPGHDIAIVIPFLNRSRWWHAALPESAPVAAHVHFFTDDGSLIEATYPAMWLQETRSHVSFRIGEVKELILALTEGPIRGSSNWRVPECHARSGEVQDLVQAHQGGEMLSLKFLADRPTVLTAKVQIIGDGFTFEGTYTLYLEEMEPGAEQKVQTRWKPFVGQPTKV
ncbi:hypothetical protein [Paludibaculum fermentans]|uniref:hypothetical protein n=1 Tax=Paludibaculum fermentans TaxID=1473598 RepID=UPI003EB8DC53